MQCVNIAFHAKVMISHSPSDMIYPVCSGWQQGQIITENINYFPGPTVIFCVSLAIW